MLHIRLFFILTPVGKTLLTDGIRLGPDAEKTSILNEGAALSPVGSLIQNFMGDLLGETLQGENIFFIYDQFVLNKYEWLQEFVNRLITSPHMFASWPGFDVLDYRFDMIRGYTFTVLIIAYDTDKLIDFFSNISLNYNWGVAKLIIVSLNSGSRFNGTLFSSSVQRSNYIFIAELIQFRRTYNMKTYSIYPYIRKVNGLDKWKINLGAWTGPRSKNEIFINRLKDFNGRMFYLSAICDDFPYIYKDINGQCIGSNIEVLNIIVEKLNFKFDVPLMTKDGLWTTFKNGTWGGLPGELVNNGKEIIINFMVLFEEMMAILDIAYPYRIEGMGMLAALPPPLPSWNTIFVAFSGRIWIYLGLTLLGVIFILYFLIRFNGIDDRKSFSMIALVMIGVLLRQFDIVIRIRRVWYNLFLTTWICASFVITSAYMGLMISFLSVPRFPHLLQTVEELAATPELKACKMNFGENFFDTLRNSPNKALQTIENKMIKFPNDFNFDKIMENVRNGTCAMIDAYPMTLYLRYRYNLTEQVYAFKNQMFRTFISFVFSKHSLLTTPIGDLMMRLNEAGIYNHIYDRYVETIRGTTVASQQGTAISLRLQDLQAPFYFTLVGFIFALTVFILEVIEHTKKK